MFIMYFKWLNGHILQESRSFIFLWWKIEGFM